jgi:hypothetical protein
VLTCVEDALLQMCNTLNFVSVHQRLQMTPTDKIPEGEIGASRQPLHRPSTSYPVIRELPVQPLSCYADGLFLSYGSRLIAHCVYNFFLKLPRCSCLEIVLRAILTVKSF